MEDTKNIIGKDSRRSMATMSFNTNNESVSDSTYISKVSIHFFLSIGPQLAKKISNTTNPLTYVNIIKRSIVILDVTSEEVKSVIH